MGVRSREPSFAPLNAARFGPATSSHVTTYRSDRPTLTPEANDVDSLQLETLRIAPCSGATLDVPLPSQDDIHTQAAALVRHVVRGSRVVEQRSSPRYPFGRLVQLVPIDSAGRPLVDKTIVAVGKNVSLVGMSLFHHQPLPYRHVLACIEMSPDASFRIPLDLNWCRFTRLGWYESGGRFSTTSGVAVPSLSGALMIPRNLPELLP